VWIVRGGGGRSSFAPARRPSRRPRPDKWEGLGSNNNSFHLREVFFVLVGAAARVRPDLGYLLAITRAAGGALDSGTGETRPRPLGRRVTMVSFQKPR